MKRKIFAVWLALWTALSLLCVTVRADQSGGAYSIRAEIVGGQDHGRLELTTDRADAGDTVLLLADPDDGYLVEIRGICADGSPEPRVTYGGLDTYAVTMPAADVRLEVRFVRAGGGVYDITASVNDSRWGALTVSRTSAMEGEYVVVEAAPRTGCILEGLTVLGIDGLPVKGGYVQTRDGVLIFEYCLPDAGLVIEGRFAEDPDSIARQLIQTWERVNGLLGSILDPWHVAAAFRTAFTGG